MTAKQTSILLVEDDPDLAEMVAQFLQGHDFAVAIETRGDTACERIVAEQPDVVILDVNLPGTNGLDVCRTVREQYSGPIIILTARGDEVDEIIGLEVGADDYMTKPVRPRLLLARLRAHLRKTSPAPESQPRRIRNGDLVIDAGRRLLEINGETVDLTTAEFDLLWMLAEKAGEVISREDIYQQLLEIPYDGVDRSIDLRISRLRRKVGDDANNPTRIKSVRGVGYILVLDK